MHLLFSISQANPNCFFSTNCESSFLSCWLNLLASWLRSLSTESIYQPSHILDAIANISVSKTKDEVVAVAVQVCKKDTRLIVASIETLPDSTIAYLKEICNLLKQLSKDYAGMSGDSVSPTLHMNQGVSIDAQMRIVNFRRKILRFCHRSLLRRISKNYSKLIPLRGDKARMLGLHSTLLENEALKPSLNQPALADKDCDVVWRLLVDIRCRIHHYSETIKYFENTQDIPFPVSRYLSKIVSIYEDFRVLLQAAHTPPLDDLWQRDFQIINVKGSGDIPSDQIKSCVEWTQLVEDTLRIRNIAAEEKELVRYVLNEIDVRQHTVTMCKTTIRKGAQVVHCELKIVSYIFQSHHEQGFLDYIGISKPCCNGCVQLLLAVKSVLGHRFRVKDAYRMFYYPWAFPPNIPHAASVAKQMRKPVSFDVGQDYRGFRPEKYKRHVSSKNSDSEETIVIDGEPEDEDPRSASATRGALIQKREKSAKRRSISGVDVSIN